MLTILKSWKKEDKRTRRSSQSTKLRNRGRSIYIDKGNRQEKPGDSLIPKRPELVEEEPIKAIGLEQGGEDL